MAECKWCENEMSGENAVASCEWNTRVLFPDKTWDFSVPYADSERCHDCNIAPGGFHHPGCCLERCPKCGGQLISCGCLDDEEEES